MTEMEKLAKEGLKLYNGLMKCIEDDNALLPDWSGVGFMQAKTIESAHATVEDLETLFQDLKLKTIRIEAAPQESPEDVIFLGLGFAKNNDGIESILVTFKDSLDDLEITSPTLN